MHFRVTDIKLLPKGFVQFLDDRYQSVAVVQKLNSLRKSERSSYLRMERKRVDGVGRNDGFNQVAVTLPCLHASTRCWTGEGLLSKDWLGGWLVVLCFVSGFIRITGKAILIPNSAKLAERSRVVCYRSCASVLPLRAISYYFHVLYYPFWIVVTLFSYSTGTQILCRSLVSLHAVLLCYSMYS